MTATTATDTPATTSRWITPWDLVVACLSYRGRCRHMIPPALAREARMVCDGFGDLATSGLPADCLANCLLDWSHVRDSSETARIRCAQILTDGLAFTGKLAIAFRTIRDQGPAEPLS